MSIDKLPDDFEAIKPNIPSCGVLNPFLVEVHLERRT